MNRSRLALGYVVEVDGSYVTVNLAEDVRSHVAGHFEGVSSFEQPNDLIAVEAGSDVLIAKVLTLLFAEPRELHAVRTGQSHTKPPLRQLKCKVIGLLRRNEGRLEFAPQTARLPALGAQALPLTGDELKCALSDSSSALDANSEIIVGREMRNPSISVSGNLDNLLSRHLAVLGATGQGKTHFVADLAQQIADKKLRSRIVIFDVNGEYYRAFKYLGKRVKYTILGENTGNATEGGGAPFKIPYYSLGRHGLFRLLLPSEKSQAPALRFAIEHLPYVEANEAGARPAGDASNVLFDDCRPGNATSAHNAIDRISQKVTMATQWPHMKAMSCLVADFYALQQKGGVYERNAFSYGHIQSLVTRVNALIADSQFRSIVDVDGVSSAPGSLNMENESKIIVDKIFGAAEFSDDGPSVHVINLSQLTQDLMPFVLGSLLELFAQQLFLRGAGKTHPTLLVLEEAHHYLRQLPGDSETGQHVLAYERLAKEGRKFGISLLVSTQRPSELSPTVLAQCGTWAVFRLTNEVDKRAVAAASEDSGADITSQLSGLGRGEAIVFGAAFQLPIRICREPLTDDRKPDSLDPQFNKRWT